MCLVNIEVLVGLEMLIKVNFELVTDITHLSVFLREFFASSMEMTAYNVKFLTVDCPTYSQEISYCQRKDVETEVFIFKDGEEIIHLGLDTMFDVSSIVSNVLQIVLLREVPIIQKQKQRTLHEQTLAGHSDLIFSYQGAIGTYEHRIFMEVAHAYTWKYRFALTTEASAVNDLPGYIASEDSAIWVIPCSKAKNPTDPEGCKGGGQAIKYKGVMSLFPLANFMKFLDVVPIHDVSVDGLYNPYKANNMNTVYIYYDQQSRTQVMKEAGMILGEYRGHVGILMVDVKLKRLSDFGYLPQWKIPALAVQLDGSDELKPMLEYFNPVQFVGETLNLAKSESASHESGETWTEKPLEEDMDPDDLSNVEIQDDPVAEAVYSSRHSPPDRTHLLTLTRKNYESEINEREFTMVLYFLTFDARSMAFMYSYSEAANALAKLSETDMRWKMPLATMDCYDWTDICDKINVTTYPTVRIYRKGHEPIEYKGLLSTQAVASAVRFGIHPMIMKDVSNVSVVGLFPDVTHSAVSEFREAAKQLHGKVLCGIAFGEVASEMFAAKAADFETSQLPSLVMVKRSDVFQPRLSVPMLTSANAIVKWISQSKMPLLPQLTAENYPYYYQLQKPFLILFTEDISAHPLYKILGDLAQDSDAPEATYSWMSIRKEDHVNQRILQFYLKSQKISESLVFVCFLSGRIFIYPENEGTVDEIKTWMIQALNNAIEFTSTLEFHEWKPRHPGYDFLKMMDEEATRDPDVHDNYDPLDPDSAYEYQPRGDDPDDETRKALQELRDSRLFHQKPKPLRKHPSDSRPEDSQTTWHENPRTEL
ncbi:hypothetical protein CAPTEDRAFT_225624 [Capitella teleta]|uniref:Uncharacterized protein n=1 Tax=Capitella teleta TaxID=283909 RepID=R7TMF8_CAPTE|nr:hypothetical protein CAPTEDRAFT_225624 [Capitella teleta]|eukprot:ELT95048.1 hypothetical protein CAPTEDRAFT_225624 [Capitella teleta]